MPVNSVGVGDNVISLDAVSTVVNGTAFMIAKAAADGQITWTYEPGANKPTSGCIALQISPDNVGWTTVDAINNLSVGSIRQVDVGRQFFVRAAVLLLVIGGGDPFTCRLLI